MTLLHHLHPKYDGNSKALVWIIAAICSMHVGMAGATDRKNKLYYDDSGRSNSHIDGWPTTGCETTPTTFMHLRRERYGKDQVKSYEQGNEISKKGKREDEGKKYSEGFYEGDATGVDSEKLHHITFSEQVETSMPRYAIFEGRMEIYGRNGISYNGYNTPVPKGFGFSARSEFFMDIRSNGTRDKGLYRKFNLPLVWNRNLWVQTDVSTEIHKPMHTKEPEEETGFYSVCRSGDWMRFCVQSWVSGPEMWGILNGLCCTLGHNDKINNIYNSPAFSTESFNNSNIKILFENILSEYGDKSQADGNTNNYPWDLVNVRMSEGSVLVIDLKVEEDNIVGVEEETQDHVREAKLSLSGIGEVDIHKCRCYERDLEPMARCIMECNQKIPGHPGETEIESSAGKHHNTDSIDKAKTDEPGTLEYVFKRGPLNEIVVNHVQGSFGWAYISPEDFVTYAGWDPVAEGVASLGWAYARADHKVFDFGGEVAKSWKRSYNINPHYLVRNGPDTDIRVIKDLKDSADLSRWRGNPCETRFNMGNMKHVEVNGSCVLADTSNDVISFISHGSKDAFECETSSSVSFEFANTQTVDIYGDICRGYVLVASKGRPLLKDFVCNVPCSGSKCIQYMNYELVQSIPFQGECYTFDIDEQLPVSLENVHSVYGCNHLSTETAVYTLSWALSATKCGDLKGTKNLRGLIGKNFICSKPCEHCLIPYTGLVIAVRDENCAIKLNPEVTGVDENIWVNSYDMEHFIHADCKGDKSPGYARGARIYTDLCLGEEPDYDMYGYENNTEIFRILECSSRCVTSDISIPSTTPTVTITSSNPDPVTTAKTDTTTSSNGTTYMEGVVRPRCLDYDSSGTLVGSNGSVCATYFSPEPCVCPVFCVDQKSEEVYGGVLLENCNTEPEKCSKKVVTDYICIHNKGTNSEDLYNLLPYGMEYGSLTTSTTFVTLQTYYKKTADGVPIALSALKEIEKIYKVKTYSTGQSDNFGELTMFEADGPFSCGVPMKFKLRRQKGYYIKSLIVEHNLCNYQTEQGGSCEYENGILSDYLVNAIDGSCKGSIMYGSISTTPIPATIEPTTLTTTVPTTLTTTTMVQTTKTTITTVITTTSTTTTSIFTTATTVSTVTTTALQTTTTTGNSGNPCVIGKSESWDKPPYVGRRSKREAVKDMQEECFVESLSACQGICRNASSWAGFDVNTGKCRCAIKTENHLKPHVDRLEHGHNNLESSSDYMELTEGSWEPLTFRRCVTMDQSCPGDYLTSENYNSSLKRCHRGECLSTVEELVDIDICGGVDMFMSQCSHGDCKIKLYMDSKSGTKSANLNGNKVYLNSKELGVARVGIDTLTSELNYRKFQKLSCNVLKLDTCNLFNSISVQPGTYVKVDSSVLFSTGSDIPANLNSTCWLKCNELSQVWSGPTTITQTTVTANGATGTTETTTAGVTTTTTATTATTKVTTASTGTTTQPNVTRLISATSVIPGYGIMYDDSILWKPDDILYYEGDYFSNRVSNLTSTTMFSLLTVYKGTLDCRQNGYAIPCYDDVICWKHLDKTVCLDQVKFGYTNLTVKTKDNSQNPRGVIAAPYRKITFSPVYTHIKKVRTMCLEINGVSIINKYGWFGGTYDRNAGNYDEPGNSYRILNCTMMTMEYGKDIMLKQFNGQKESPELKVVLDKEEFCRSSEDRVGSCKFGEIYYDSDWKWWHIPKPYARVRFNNIIFEYNTRNSYCDNGVGNVIPEAFMTVQMCKDLSDRYHETNESIDWSMIIVIYMLFGGINGFIKCIRIFNHIAGGTMLLESKLMVLKMQYKGSKNASLSALCHNKNHEDIKYDSELSRGKIEYNHRERFCRTALEEAIGEIEKLAKRKAKAMYKIRTVQRFLILYFPTYEYIALTLQTAWLLSVGGLMYMYMWFRTRKFPVMSKIFEKEKDLDDMETIDILGRMPEEHTNHIKHMSNRKMDHEMNDGVDIIESSLKKGNKWLARAYRKAKTVEHNREFKGTFRFAWIFFLLFIGEVHTLTLSVVTDCKDNICTKTLVYTTSVQTCTGCETKIDLTDHDTGNPAGYLSIKVLELEYYNVGAYDYTIPMKLIANSIPYAHDQEDCDDVCTNPYEMPTNDPFSNVWWNFVKDKIQGEEIMGPWYYCMGVENTAGTWENPGSCSGYISFSPDWSDSKFRVFDYSDTKVRGKIQIEYDWGEGVVTKEFLINKDAESFEWEEGQVDVDIPYTSFDLSGEKVGCLFDNDRSSILEDCFRNFEGFQTMSTVAKFRGEGYGTIRAYNARKPTGVCTGGRMSNGIMCQWSYTWEGLMAPSLTDIGSLGSIIEPYSCSGKVTHDVHENVEGGICKDGSDKTESECNSKLTRFGEKWIEKGYNYPGPAIISRSNCGGKKISLIGTLETQFDGSINHNTLSASDLAADLKGCYGKRSNAWILINSEEAGMIYMKSGSLEVPPMVGTSGSVNVSCSAMGKEEIYYFEVCDETISECDKIEFGPIERCEDYTTGGSAVVGGDHPESGNTTWPWWYYLIIAIGCFLAVLIVILIIVLIVRCASAPKSTMVINTKKKKTEKEID